MNKSVNVLLSLQLDFFHLIKTTLLQYDLEYSYASSDQVYLTLKENDLRDFTQSQPLKDELSKIIRGNGKEIYHYRNHITQKEERVKENLNSRFSFLLLGSMKKRATEQIKIINNLLSFKRKYKEHLLLNY